MFDSPFKEVGSTSSTLRAETTVGGFVYRIGVVSSQQSAVSSQQSAVRAAAEDLQRVAHLAEAMRGGYVCCPSLHRRSIDLHGATALPAHQMVMMSATAFAIRRFTILTNQHVDLISCRK